MPSHLRVKTNKCQIFYVDKLVSACNAVHVG